MEDFTQLGVGGIFVVLVLDRVFKFINGRQTSGAGDADSGLGIKGADVRRKVHELHEWHDHDEMGEGATPGEKVWWGTALRRDMGDLARSVDGLAGNVAAQTTALDTQNVVIGELKTAVERMNGRD